MMRFSQLRVGDFFHAYGDTYLKLPHVVMAELPDANAVNAITGQLACFGHTVPVKYMLAGQMEPSNGRLQKASSCDETNAFSTRRFR